MNLGIYPYLSSIKDFLYSVGVEISRFICKFAWRKQNLSANNIMVGFPKITVITVCMNAADALERTLKNYIAAGLLQYGGDSC